MSLDNLPKDSMMLLSFVNTRLRDDCIKLDDFCSQFSVSKDELCEKLKAIDYTYNEELNKFI